MFLNFFDVISIFFRPFFEVSFLCLVFLCFVFLLFLLFYVLLFYVSPKTLFSLAISLEFYETTIDRKNQIVQILVLLHSDRLKLYTILAFLRAIGIR